VVAGLVTGSSNQLTKRLRTTQQFRITGSWADSQVEKI
jgi:hypothetical protein